MSLTQAHPVVDVIWWTDSDLYVKCPFCEELHRHGFISYESALRVPHCDLPRPSYRYIFPAAYEIDKSGARWININALEEIANEVQNDSENEAVLSHQLSNMNLSGMSSGFNNREISFDDSTERITIPLEGKESFEARRILFAISNCMQGEISRVRRYVQESADKSIFLHGRDYHGDTSLIMASREKSSAMVSMLLDFGAEVNATNKNGRTALMEACLWGRLESVKILLSKGADRSLRDNRNQKALDLTEPTRQNYKERYTVGGGIWGDTSREPIYKEDVFSRDIDRREIKRILHEGNFQTKADRMPQNPETAFHSFRRSPTGQSVTLYGPIQQLPLSNPWKTIALLERGIPFPSIAAMSGWGHSQWPSTRVSGKDWTERVLKLAAIVGHTLAVDASRDHGIRGQHYASHAEKQLIAYFLDRHVFLDEDKTLDSRFKKEIAEEKLKISELASIHPSIPQIYQLQHDRKQPEYELWDKDDRLLGDEYDEALVQRLKMEAAVTDDQIALLENRPEIQKLRTQERQIQLWEDREILHRRLNRMSTKAPERNLRGASILISSPRRNICQDCLLFKDRVNRCFGLSIELRECTV
ncbi:hypothetical protein PENANT_c080G08542 [Penicillium antarcticum]|uniref:Single-strand DNA deaminase toxin A-like C-terminal domain-containing protein n=1 Tax=Penicillium antarcticum TaxID=416450 RepID=A0A1V6PPA1_9EURO|nr:hypothetical protein PENANT_c080G08542 [Penicillium antarcticum]